MGKSLTELQRHLQGQVQDRPCDEQRVMGRKSLTTIQGQNLGHHRGQVQGQPQSIPRKLKPNLKVKVLIQLLIEVQGHRQDLGQLGNSQGILTRNMGRKVLTKNLQDVQSLHLHLCQVQGHRQNLGQLGNSPGILTRNMGRKVLTKNLQDVQGLDLHLCQVQGHRQNLGQLGNSQGNLTRNMGRKVLIKNLQGGQGQDHRQCQVQGHLVHILDLIRDTEVAIRENTVKGTRTDVILQIQRQVQVHDPLQGQGHTGPKSQNLRKQRDHRVQVLGPLQSQGHIEPKGQNQRNQKDHPVHLIRGQGHMVGRSQGHTSQEGQKDMLLYPRILIFPFIDIHIVMGILDNILNL